jgi:type II secretory pathway component GspD/PulD (secretin)
MWSLQRLRWARRAGTGLALLLVLTSCQRHEEGTAPPSPRPAKASRQPKPAEPAPAEPAAPAKPAREPFVSYSALHDEEIKEILRLADAERWEEAEARARALEAKDPQDSAAKRLLGWVQKERETQRTKALEDRIREIDAKHSVFNPTVKDLLTESKDRGLPPRKDVRDLVDQIESSPYIPSTFGKTNRMDGILFDLESQESRMARILDKPISIQLDNATLNDIIFNIGQTEGINFVADKALPAFAQKLSINMERVKLSELLRYIARNLDLHFQVGEDLVWIVDGKDPKRAMEETRFYKLRRGFILPARFGPDEVIQTRTVANNVQTITEVQKLNAFVNDMAPATISLERAITNFFTGSKYMLDYERNLIVASGTREQLEVLERVIREFDQPLQQVFIEARFVTITEAAFLRLGVAWESGRTTFATDTEGDNSTATALGLINPALGIQEVFTNILNRPTLTATLSLLDRSGESQLLSAPRLTVINNLPARISDGKMQYYYEEYQVKQQILERRSSSAVVPSGKPTKIQSGASLDVLASVGGDGRTIFLALKPSVNSQVKLVPFATITDKDDAGNVVSTFDIKLPEYRTQEIATRVAIRSGQTVAMGGVLEREQTTYVESVPILGNIPILGAAFRRRTEVDRPRYLLIFVTATLLSESGEFLLYDEPITAAAPAPAPPPASSAPSSFVPPVAPNPTADR